MYEYGLGGGWYGHTLFGGFFMIIILVAIIFFIVWLVRGWSCASCKKSEHSEPHAKTALGILNERYAKGDIDRKEFEEKKKDLNS